MLRVLFVAILCVAFLLGGIVVGWVLKRPTMIYQPYREIDGVATVYPFTLTIAPEKTIYEPEEIIEMTVTLKNVGEEEATITFSHMGNPSPYWFWRVYDVNNETIFYYKYMTGLPALDERTLQPGGFMQRNYTWNQKNTDTEQQVSTGIYYLTAAVGFEYNDSGVSLEARKNIEIAIPNT